ncbi:transcriptional regulator [Temperatibacter marinus]|uniref:Transcriptional regulator n=1 Tax=Temperatibacter marinus TaxID=1456591 RepID=A0AA52EHV5_9PROT|nr:transcriptional regulator [Temperatibacter marinus]WND03453.1 transcriptional regulator [Temperatibacter marinus]
MSDFDYRILDDIIHSRVRLAIMSYLMTARSEDFTALKKQLNLTDGNLSTHLSKLEITGYVVLEKQFIGKKPQTTVKLSAEGEKAFGDYLHKLTAMIGNPS